MKIFSEVIVAFKCGPLARIETGYVIKTGPNEKFLQNKISTYISGPHLKIKNQIKAYQNYGPSEKIF